MLYKLGLFLIIIVTITTMFVETRNKPVSAYTGPCLGYFIPNGFLMPCSVAYKDFRSWVKAGKDI